MFQTPAEESTSRQDTRRYTVLSSGNSLYFLDLVCAELSCEQEDTIKLFLWTVTNLFPAFHNCVCRSHIRIWYRCHVPSPCHIRHVSRVSVRKSALLPSNIHIQWCSLTAIRLSDTGTRRALCNQLDCYSNCHGTCCCNCELIQILRINSFLCSDWDAHQMATKWKGDPLTDKHVPSLYLEPSNTLWIAPSVSVTSVVVSKSQ